MELSKYSNRAFKAIRRADIVLLTVDVTEGILALGANTEVENEGKKTPLLVACENGHETVAGRLLAAGANAPLASVLRVVLGLEHNLHDLVLLEVTLTRRGRQR